MSKKTKNQKLKARVKKAKENLVQVEQDKELDNKAPVIQEKAPKGKRIIALLGLLLMGLTVWSLFTMLCSRPDVGVETTIQEFLQTDYTKYFALFLFSAFGTNLCYNMVKSEEEESAESTVEPLNNEEEKKEDEIAVTFADVWRLSKNRPVPEKLAARITMSLLWILIIIGKSTLYFFLLSLYYAIIFGSLDISYLLVTTLVYCIPETLMYEYPVLYKETFVKLFGNQKYTTPEKPRWLWKVLFIIIAASVGILVSA